MKKAITTLALIFGISLGHAQIEVYPNSNVGIGTLQFPGFSPTFKLDVSGSAYLRCLPASSGIYFENYNNQFNGQWFNEPILRGQWGNSVWIGKPNDWIWRVYSNRFYAPTVNDYLATSDVRLKTNIRSLENSMDKLLRLKPLRYDLNLPVSENTSPEKRRDIEERGKNNIGFSAQELKEIFPEMVTYDKENDRYAVAYMALIPVLVKAIQEQQKEIEELKLKSTPNTTR